MLKRVVISIAVFILLAVTLVDAGAKREVRQDKQEVLFDKESIAQTKRTLVAIDHAIDLWHDANLKDNKRLTRQYEVQIAALLQTDIEVTTRIISQCQREISQSKAEWKKPHDKWCEKTDDRKDYKDDKWDLKQAKSWLKVKKRLAKSISKTDAFSNKFRLLGDYVGVLRTQLGAERVELVEDIRELRGDR